MRKHNPFIAYSLERMQLPGPARALARFGGCSYDHPVYARVATGVNR